MIKAYLVPHPPLIVKGVGDGSEIPQTRAAYEQISREMQEYNPDTVVIISPHSVLYADYFHIYVQQKDSRTCILSKRR
jgi:aromatic ring-opening dioxygenase LigB subunit